VVKIAVPFAVLALFLGLAVYPPLRRLSRQEGAVNEAERLLARGDLDGALDRASRAVESTAALLGARAALVEAAVAFRRARLDASLQSLARAVGLVGSALRNAGQPEVELAASVLRFPPEPHPSAWFDPRRHLA
jgi:hypothetical protein